jgi:hypothetical protein
LVIDYGKPCQGFAVFRYWRLFMGIVSPIAKPGSEN